MVDSPEPALDAEPVPPSGLLEVAVNNLALGLVIFDGNNELVFCNKRYMEIYGLGPEQVRPGTPIKKLIQHRLSLGFKAPSKPGEYIRELIGSGVAQGTAVQEFADGRIIAFTIYPMPGGGGMATHEDITRGGVSCDVPGRVPALAQQRCRIPRAHRQHRRTEERPHLQDSSSADARRR